MKKQALLQAFLGFPIGIAIGQVISRIMSLIFAEGYFSPVVPVLIDETGSEIGAVILQTILCGTLSATFSGTSVIFQNDNWSIVKQTLIHFSVTTPVFLIIAYVLHWMQRSFFGLAMYFVTVVIIYIFMFLINYIFWRHKIKSINKKLTEIGGKTP